MKNRNIFIRTDFGNVIGDGHLFRTKALASQLIKLTDNVYYVTRPHQGANSDKMSSYKFILLDPPYKENPDRDNYADWLSRTEQEDAEECLRKTSPNEGDIWIVDHYGINSEWELILRANKQIVIAIDDLFRQHACDVLIDHNLTASTDEYSVNSLNPFTKYFIGPQYALLREEIINSNSYNFNNGQEKILIYLGACPSDFFLKIQKAVRATCDLPIHYLSPPVNFEILSNEFIIPFQDDLMSVYQNYKLIVGSCGVANLERMALSVPSITCGIIDNQKHVSSFLSTQYPLLHLGMIKDLSENELKNKLDKIFKLKCIDLSRHVGQLEECVAKNGVSRIIDSISKL
jgi:UDP-2,4-diacetamido-2,4,6-trideoxy-beta-L-altropyranose hydrolase